MGYDLARRMRWSRWDDEENMAGHGLPKAVKSFPRTTFACAYSNRHSAPPKKKTGSDPVGRMKWPRKNERKKERNETHFRMGRIYKWSHVMMIMMVSTTRNKTSLSLSALLLPRQQNRQKQKLRFALAASTQNLDELADKVLFQRKDTPVVLVRLIEPSTVVEILDLPTQLSTRQRTLSVADSQHAYLHNKVHS